MYVFLNYKALQNCLFNFDYLLHVRVDELVDFGITFQQQ